jgi:hypothetical protein
LDSPGLLIEQPEAAQDSMLEALLLVPERSVLLPPGSEPQWVEALLVPVVVEHTAAEALVVAHIRSVDGWEVDSGTRLLPARRQGLTVDTVAESALLRLECLLDMPGSHSLVLLQ